MPEKFGVLSGAMNNFRKENIILSIETIVEGGSLSILKDGKEFDSWFGTVEVSKAEDVLEQISRLFENNGLERREITTIIFSKGVENLTGGKIGAAIAKGLAKALKCRLIGVSLFESLLLIIRDREDGEYLTAVPVGKQYINWHRFSKKGEFFYQEQSNPEISVREEFYRKLKGKDFKNIVSIPSLSKLDETGSANEQHNENSFIFYEQSLAKLNGIYILNEIECVR